jgi:hypothetical protein
LTVEHVALTADFRSGGLAQSAEDTAPKGRLHVLDVLGRHSPQLGTTAPARPWKKVYGPNL